MNFMIWNEPEVQALGIALKYKPAFQLLKDLPDEYFFGHIALFKAMKKRFDDGSKEWNIPDLVLDSGLHFSDVNAVMDCPTGLHQLSNVITKLHNKVATQKFLTKVDEIRENYESGRYEIDIGVVRELNEIVSYTAGDRWTSANKVVEYLTRDRKKPRMYKSKFSGLNEIIFSYITQKLYIVSARPGAGKSTFLLNEAIHLAKNGAKVAFFTLEMGREECFQRCTANVCSVEYNKLYDIDNPEVLEKYATFGQYAGDRLNFYEAYSLHWLDIIKEIRAVVKQNGTEIVIVDQLSHIKHDEHTYSKTHAIEKTVRALKELANELNIVIIVASQLNREAVKDGAPSLIHLKDSGAIEEGADVVMLLTRKENNSLEILVEKNRSGKIGKTTIAWLFEYSRMSDPEYYDIPEDVIEYAQQKYFKKSSESVENKKQISGGDEWLYDF